MSVADKVYVSTKPFTTYDEQIDLLGSKGLIIRDRERVKQILKETSYFALINGYKHPFKADDGNYKAGTCFEDIMGLYYFDAALRSWFLRYVLIIERKLKSLTSYYASQQFSDDPMFYLKPENYRDRIEVETSKRIDKLIYRIKRRTEDPNQRYLNHYINNHDGVIPLWVSICALTFGEAANLLDLCLPNIKDAVATEYNVRSQELNGMCMYLTEVRNICAHNERFYDYKGYYYIPFLDIHKAQRIKSSKSKCHNGPVRGSNDLYAALICFKYLLPKEVFEDCKDGLHNIFANFRLETNTVTKTTIIQQTGLPINWKSIIE